MCEVAELMGSKKPHSTCHNGYGDKRNETETHASSTDEADKRQIPVQTTKKEGKDGPQMLDEIVISGQESFHPLVKVRRCLLDGTIRSKLTTKKKH